MKNDKRKTGYLYFIHACVERFVEELTEGKELIYVEQESPPQMTNIVILRIRLKDKKEDRPYDEIYVLKISKNQIAYRQVADSRKNGYRLFPVTVKINGDILSFRLMSENYEQEPIDIETDVSKIE